MPRRKRIRRDAPDPVDIHVGARVRLRRTLLGLSQEKLGAALGLTFQQVQKYERGANRIGASRLWQISRALDVPVSFFFDDQGAAAAASTEAPGILLSREMLEMARAYAALPPEIRRRLFTLTKSIRDAQAAAQAARPHAEIVNAYPPAVLARAQGGAS
jgi:transcriptional regulator with XRE-family HTH domain